MIQKIIQWLPLIIAFIAGVFALHQIRSNNITNARIKWLENLKQILTEFLAECAILQLKEGVTKGMDERGESSPIPDTARAYYFELSKSFIGHLKTIDSKYDLIKLNLNPKEDLHQKLEKLLDDYIEFFNGIPKEKKLENYDALVRKMGAYSDSIVLLVRYIMKLEWEKTKRSYFSRLYYMKFSKGKILLKEALQLELLPERAAPKK